jgi:hypothetical protein
MANMSYCRFENTARDLRDCIENWNSELSNTEQLGKDSIIQMARQILLSEGFAVIFPESDYVDTMPHNEPERGKE